MKNPSDIKAKGKDRLTGKFTDIVIKIEQNKVFTAIKNGLVMLIPVFLIGSVALILLNIPIPAYTEFIKGTDTKTAFLNGFVRGFPAVFAQRHVRDAGSFALAYHKLFIRQGAPA